MINVKAGDIVFVRNRGLISSLIRFFDKGHFSHVCVAVSDSEIVEAQYYTTVRKTEMKYSDYEIVRLNLSEDEINKMVILTEKLIGEWYDYPQILYYIVQKLFGLKGKNVLNSPNNLICSELIFVLLNSIGKLDGINKIDADVTPNELYKFLKQIK